MDWIAKNLRVFQTTTVVCAISAAAIVAWFNVPAGRTIHLSRTQCGIVFLPWFVGMIAFAPWVYVSWSRGVKSALGRLSVGAFVAVYFAAVLVIFVGIYGHFLFQVF